MHPTAEPDYVWAQPDAPQDTCTCVHTREVVIKAFGLRTEKVLQRAQVHLEHAQVHLEHAELAALAILLLLPRRQLYG